MVFDIFEGRICMICLVLSPFTIKDLTNTFVYICKHTVYTQYGLLKPVKACKTHLTSVNVEQA